jgi:CDP-diacylglycerol--glycerol-3-phosphate 3-phosphatidyltransferase
MVDSPRRRWQRHLLASPLTLLAGSAVLSGVTTFLVVADHLLLAGISAAFGAGALLAGTMAARRDRSRRARLAERIMDRAFDACILAPVAWVTRADSVTAAVLALVGLSGSFLASYERAKAQSLGYRGGEGTGYRAARAGLLVGGLLTGWVEASLWLFVVLTLAASAVRTWNVVLQERRAGEPARARGTR